MVKAGLKQTVRDSPCLHWRSAESYFLGYEGLGSFGQTALSIKDTLMRSAYEINNKTYFAIWGGRTEHWILAPSLSEDTQLSTSLHSEDTAVGQVAEAQA